MRVLTTAMLAERFSKLITAAIGVDIAVAWITNSDQLLELQGRAVTNALNVRVIVGLNQNVTHPLALETISRFAEVRGIKNRRGLFHPKLYIFHLPNETVVWIGSPNFTKRAFSANNELVAEVTSDHQEAFAWFDRCWKSIGADESNNVIAEYIENWTPPERNEFENEIPLPNTPKINTRTFIRNYSNDLPNMLNCDWSSYVNLLYKRDNFWRQTTTNDEGWPVIFSVLDENFSYLETISAGEAVAKYANWGKLSSKEANMLLGLNEQQGAWGLLGSMKGAGRAKNIFLADRDTNGRDNLAVRRNLHADLKATVSLATTDDYLRQVETTLELMTEIPGIGIGVASRLLTLTRPDMAVALNGGSNILLSHLTGINLYALQGSNIITKYIELLQWVYKRPWYQAAEPSDPFEKTLWTKRAALIDCFVYQVPN